METTNTKNIEIKTNNVNSKGNSSKFTISFDHKWTRWLFITLICLVVLLLLKLTGADQIILNVILVFIPLGLALAVIWVLNPLIYRLIKLKFNKTVAKYLTFFISLIIGIFIIVFLLWLFIDQFVSFISQFLGDSTVIKERLDNWKGTGVDQNKSLLSHIFGFGYDTETEQWRLQTNVDWTPIKDNWQDILSQIKSKALDNKSAWEILLTKLRNDYGIYLDSTNKFVVDYLRYLKQPSLDSVIEYFTNLYTEIQSWLNTNNIPTSVGPNEINLNLVNEGVINSAKIGVAFDGNKLGKMYQLLFSFGATAQWFFSATFLVDIINTIYGYTTASNLTNILLNRYFWTIASIFYGLFITIMITMFLLGGDKSFTNFLKTQLIPGKNIKRKEIIANALQKSLFGYGRGILIDMSYMFTFTTIMMAIAGYVGGGSTYKSSFAVLGLFMTFANIVPYVGPFIGMVPIALAGVLDALVAPSGTNELVSWVPMIVAVVGAFIVQLIENAFVYPKIFGRVTKLHPVTILMGISIFGAIIGIWGMIIVVPTIATIKAVANDIYDKKLLL
ncbi:AI-2E family transporter [Spiroplasma endosymbiont of Asaphidion curtum]|uniref:AI-2E family transporter n=1 Tax=Spiroplasma endosymbiont of Asaphidion curtum TaxID=3066281 RepID=UPI00313EF962